MSCSRAPVTATSRSMPGNVADIALTASATLRRVLEQPMAVGLVVELRRRSDPVGGPQRRGLTHQAVHQAAQVGSGSWRSARAGRPPSARPRAAGPAQQILGREAARLGAAQRGQVELRRRSAVDDIAADDPNGVPARARLATSRDRVPDHRRELSRAVAERDPQEFPAIAR